MNRKTHFGLLLLLALNGSHFVMNELRSADIQQQLSCRTEIVTPSAVKCRVRGEDRNLKTGQVIAEI
jgi:hypothetical protein